MCTRSGDGATRRVGAGAGGPAERRCCYLPAPAGGSGEKPAADGEMCLLLRALSSLDDFVFLLVCVVDVRIGWVRVVMPQPVSSLHREFQLLDF